MITADAVDLPDEVAPVDAVVWDPPYFDNIDYSTIARPFYKLLKELVEDLYSDRFSRGEPPSGTSLSRSDRKVSDKVEAYMSSLRQQAVRAGAVLRSGGHLGVFWVARSPEALAEFTALVQSTGLELREVLRLDHGLWGKAKSHGKSSVTDAPEAFLLIFQSVAPAAQTTAELVDSHQVIKLASLGQTTLYAGIAELLEQEWEPEDFAAKIPSTYTGSQRRKLDEYVASHPRPEALLVELGRSTLRRHAERLGLQSDVVRITDVDVLARELLRHFGFTVPTPSPYSMTSALGKLGSAVARLQLTASREDAKGVYLTASTEVERLVRFVCLAWTYLQAQDEFEDLLAGIVERTGNKAYPGWHKLSFGDWKSCLLLLPQTLAGADGVGSVFAYANRGLKKQKLDEKLSRVVSRRTDLAHDKGQTDQLNDGELRKDLAASIGSVLAGFRTLVDTRHLPICLQPVDERRDRYGRFTLRLVDEEQREVEMYVQGPADLTAPVLWFDRGGGARDIDPFLLPVKTIANLLESRGLSPHV